MGIAELHVGGKDLMTKGPHLSFFPSSLEGMNLREINLATHGFPHPPDSAEGSFSVRPFLRSCRQRFERLRTCLRGSSQSRQ